MARVYVRPTEKTRRRRRRKRLITLVAYSVIVFLLAWYFDAQGTTTILFVRHADVDSPLSADVSTPLNARGLARSEQLARFLENVDVVAGPDAIYVDETTRTQQTAWALAKRLGVEPEVANHDDVVAFTDAMLAAHKREIVLVVTQADDIAPLVEELHGSKNIAEIAPDEYGWLFVVTIPQWGKVKTLQLPYSGDWLASAF